MTYGKKKLLLFHPALAPYRIDQFNELSQIFDLTVVFIFKNLWNHKFDQSKLLSQLHFKYLFLLVGPRYKGRVWRFGIYSTIRKINPDIIIGYEYSFTTQYLLLLKGIGLIKQKIGSTIDDSIEICNAVQSNIRRFARQYTVNRLDYLIVLSEEVSFFYQKTFGKESSKIVVSPILQNAERIKRNPKVLQSIAESYINFYQLKGKIVLLFVGRFIPEKGLTKFVTSITSILKQNKNVILVLIGDGEEKADLEASIHSNHLENSILLPGRYEGQNLFAWYLCASGFVLPSLYEPFGAVVNEALIFGLKVLCSRFAGSSYLIQSNCGMLYDPLDDKGTKEKLQSFVKSICPIDSIDISKNESKMQDIPINFIKQWRKLEHD